jgi:hypothetical protein
VTPARPERRGTREKQEMTATEDIPETRDARATPETKAGRDSLGTRGARVRPVSRAETAMPRHAQQASIAIGTRIPAERPASETKNLRANPAAKSRLRNNHQQKPQAWAWSDVVEALTS